MHRGDDRDVRKAKGLGYRARRGAVRIRAGGSGTPTSFTLELRLPAGCSDEQIERLSAVAAKCPVHRTLEGEVSFEQRVELVKAPAE